MCRGDVTDVPQRNPLSGFSISCVRTVRVQAVCSERTLPFVGFGVWWFLLVMSAHIRQPVREQPDTGYWKIPRADFAAAHLLLGCGGGWEEGIVKLQRRPKGTFMSAFSNKSFSHYRCVEATLYFSAIVQ